jgi:hypothetical protein
LGNFTSADLDAIKAEVARIDGLPLLSIVEKPGEGIEVTTGHVCGDECGSGNLFLLRKVNGVWMVVARSIWIS